MTRFSFASRSAWLDSREERSRGPCDTWALPTPPSACLPPGELAALAGGAGSDVAVVAARAGAPACCRCLAHGQYTLSLPWTNVARHGVDTSHSRARSRQPLLPGPGRRDRPRTRLSAALRRTGTKRAGRLRTRPRQRTRPGRRRRGSERRSRRLRCQSCGSSRAPVSRSLGGRASCGWRRLRATIYRGVHQPVTAGHELLTNHWEPPDELYGSASRLVRTAPCAGRDSALIRHQRLVPLLGSERGGGMCRHRDYAELRL